jgi:hypothetical protein
MKKLILLVVSAIFAGCKDKGRCWKCAYTSVKNIEWTEICDKTQSEIDAFVTKKKTDELLSIMSAIATQERKDMDIRKINSYRCE